MTFILPNSGSSSVSVGNSVIPGTKAPVSAGNFVSRAAIFAAQRYGPRVVGAAIQRLDSTVNNLAESISGKDGGKSSIKDKTPVNGNKDNSNSGKDKSNGGKSGNGKPPGGRRPRRRSNPGSGPGGSTGSDGIPKFSINTGILSGTLINPIQNTTKFYSPLYVQCGQLFSNISEQDDSFFSGLINSELYFKYKIIVQSVITNSFSRHFTEENFYSYISIISEALQTYYMIDSILAYTTYNSNSNIAMLRLRMAITPEIMNAHIKLKEYLETIPLPPNLVEYIRYMYQNFSFNDVVGSPIVRLSLNDTLCTSEHKGELGLDFSSYQTIFEDLIDSSETVSIMRKIRENWVKPLAPSSFEAFYDPQFSTFWHNANIAYEDYGSKAVKYTINATDFTDQLYYGIFDNRVDGLIYASCSVAIKMNQQIVQQMGIWKPFNEFISRDSINSSLLHYGNDGTVRPVTEVEFRTASMVHAAPYAEVTKDSNLVWVVNNSHYCGAAIPQVHTLENTTQAVVNSVEWLLGP